LNDPRADIARLAALLPQLVFAYRRRQGEIPEVFREAGRYGERHIAALISLAIAGPATVSELAQRLDMSKAHASLVVGQLARAGLVERENDERDRRRIIVSLSDAAKPAVAEMRRRNGATVYAFLAELGEQDAERFISQLARLIAHLRDDATADGSPPAGAFERGPGWGAGPDESRSGT
jgi:DNA-binding MarR family transcriptional regulator